MTEHEIEQRLQACDPLLEEANGAMAEGALADAKALLEEALQSLDGLAAADRRQGFKLMATRSSIHEALGVTAATGGVLAEAEEQYALALRLRERLAEQGAGAEGFEVDLPRAVTHLNLAGVLGNQERFDEAHEHAMTSVRLGTDAVQAQGDGEDNPQLDLLVLSAISSTAMIRAAGGDFPGANEAFDQGLSWARAILTRSLDGELDEAQEVEIEHLPEFLPSYGQLLLNAAMVRNVCDDNAVALDLATEAAQIGAALLEATEAEEAFDLYLGAELGTMQYATAVGRFDRAEDALFKALALAPGTPELVQMGEEFYQALLQRDDEELSAGGLPRDEVVDSLAELRGAGDGP